MSRVRGGARRARDLSALDDFALRCQLYRRHGFGLPVFVPTWLDDHKALRADVKCDCGTRKVIYIGAATFEEWSTYYVHPDGYLLEGGRPDRADTLREAHRRTTKAQVKAEERAQKAADAAEERARKEARHLRAVG